MYYRNSAFGFCLLSALVLGLPFGLRAPRALGWEEKPVVWEPLALPQVVEYIQDETLAAEELVARLVKVLESRIAWYERWAQGDRHLPKGSARWSIGQDYARMAAIIGTSGRVGGHAPPARLKSIDLALVSARRASGGGPLPPILSLARALALPVGDDWYAELLALVRSNTLEPEVKLLALQTLYPQVRLELLPLLLDLTKSPWSRSEANDTTGKFERVFPLRSVAVALLRALGGAGDCGLCLRRCLVPSPRSTDAHGGGRSEDRPRAAAGSDPLGGPRSVESRIGGRRRDAQRGCGRAAGCDQGQALGREAVSAEGAPAEGRAIDQVGSCVGRVRDREERV